MIRLAALLHRDHDTVWPACNVADGYVFGEPGDFPCRDAATRRVVVRCPVHGLRTRDVCLHHERQIVAGRHLTCEVCEQAGETVSVEFAQSGPVLRPQPKTTATTATTKERS